MMALCYQIRTVVVSGQRLGKTMLRHENSLTIRPQHRSTCNTQHSNLTLNAHPTQEQPQAASNLLRAVQAYLLSYSRNRCCEVVRVRQECDSKSGTFEALSILPWSPKSKRGREKHALCQESSRSCCES
jgi:hypothetical protein